MEIQPKRWHTAARAVLVTGGVLFSGFTLETLFLEDWPWWAWGIGAALCFVGLGVLEWHVRRQPQPRLPEDDHSHRDHFTKAEALAVVRRRRPVYWRIFGLRLRFNAKATRREAERFLAMFEDEHRLDVTEDGYDKLTLETRLAVERRWKEGPKNA